MIPGAYVVMVSKQRLLDRAHPSGATPDLRHGVWRAGRHWPFNGYGTPIHLADADDDPPAVPGAIVVGRRTFGYLQADPRLEIERC